MMQPLPRLLDPRELRVLGCLLEKEQATPEYYPMTLNAVVAACNQRSSRNPVLSLSEGEVRDALERLRCDTLVGREVGGRSTKWRQLVDRRLGLDAAGKAALTVLLLRGPQTAGEVRGRSGRLCEFATTADAESALAGLAAPPDPVVELLERDPGQKEPRWAHRLGTEEAGEVTVASAPPDRAAGPEFDPERVLRRLEYLERQMAELQAALRRPRDSR